MTYYIGNKGFVAVGLEATEKTAVATTDYLKIKSESLDTEPGFQPVPTIQGLRAENRDQFQGEAFGSGQIVSPFGPLGSIRLLGASIGTDMVSGASPASANTLASPAAVGATTVTLTSATGYVANGYIQITSVATPSLTTVHKIASVATNTLTLHEPLRYAFLSGDTTAVVIAPFTHIMLPNESDLPSLTVEKALSTLKSLQFAGQKVSKWMLKLATNAAAEATYELYGQPSTKINPSTASYVPESPFSPSQIVVGLFGTTPAKCKGVDITVDNGVKGEFVFGAANPETSFAGTRKITGTLQMLLDSASGMNFYDDAVAGTFGDLNVALTQSGALSCTIDMPKIQFGKPGIPLQLGNNIVQSLPFTAYFIAGQAYDVQVTVVNSYGAPYV